jgi:hypothetical protein
MRTGLPSASTTAWIFVDGPPRERPICWGPLSSRARGVLMGAHDRGIDEIAFAVTLTRQRFYQSCKHSRLRPSRKARVHGLPWAVRMRQVAPWRSRSQDPDHRFDHQPMRFRVTSARLRRRWQYRLGSSSTPRRSIAPSDSFASIDHISRTMERVCSDHRRFCLPRTSPGSGSGSGSGSKEPFEDAP